MLRTWFYNFHIAGEAILENKVRGFLTSLGIICGVASVIAMLAIGSGAEQEILEKMKLLGTNNIIVKPVDKEELEERKKAEENEDGPQNEKKERFTPGLTLQDATSIMLNVPRINTVSPEVVIEVMSLREGFYRNVKLVGVTESYFDINDFELLSGSRFNYKNHTHSEQVCIIGSGVRGKLFATEDPIGKSIKCGNLWLRVAGVLKERNLSRENIQNLGLRDFNFDVYIPVSTMLLRYSNRSLITKADLKKSLWDEESSEENPNQLDRIVVNIDDTRFIKSTAEIVKRLLTRRHNKVEDFEIIIPELLLEQEQNTKRIFNIVLGAIASISLLVGGIGIMNIMLASVLERTKEIGIRRAVGAKQKDVLLQFLSEAVAISLAGGITGIIIGVGGSFLIESLTGINTIVSPWAVLISFFVSISVGLIFGIAPARKASLQDPIELLRYE